MLIIMQEEYNFDPDYQGSGLDTVSTTVIEVHQGMNGVIDITGEHPTQPTVVDQDVSMNGIVMEQQQILQQAPPLFDVDLEKMQSDLFKGRYLTPQDFLDDVAKMLHNAEVRQHEDLERLHKAQQMYVAAEVSIQEFDPQLRLECERMAVRERQRREEARKEKEKEKGKGKEAPGTPAPIGTRRSARANGLQPEHPITDPVKLERRLKRQRGEESSGVDSHGSEGEANGINGIDPAGRDAKRTRIVEEQDDDRDPLDTLGSSRPGSEVRSHVVRFAHQPIEPMAPLVHPSAMGQYPQQPYPPFPQELPMSPHPSLHLNHIQPNHVNYHHMQPQAHFPNHMMVDESPSRPNGNINLLLNPTPTQNQHNVHMFNNPNMNDMSPFAQPRMNGQGYNFPTMSHDPSDPFTSPPQQQRPQPTSFLSMLNGNTPTPPPLESVQAPDLPRHHTPIPQIRLEAAPQQQLSRQPTPLPLPVTTSTPPPPREPTPMAVERPRTPTPPLPDFHVSSSLVDELRLVLKERTAELTIEELEQLRASCLGTVWRHRKEWDRDALVEQLIKDVKNFVAEVKQDNDSDED